MPKLRRNWRERFCPRFRKDIEKFVQAAEAMVWQPHWSHDDPMPDRLAPGMESLDDDDEPLTIPTFPDKRTEVNWHFNNLLRGSVKSPSVRFFQKYIDDNPDTILEDIALLGAECGDKWPRHPALVELDGIARSAGSRNRKSRRRKPQL